MCTRNQDSPAFKGVFTLSIHFIRPVCRSVLQHSLVFVHSPWPSSIFNNRDGGAFFDYYPQGQKAEFGLWQH